MIPYTKVSAKRALTLTPRLVERVWGATSLHAWYPAPAAGKPVGEVWLTAEECRVDGGEHNGVTLNALAIKNPEAFGNADGYGFPVLMKMLYPREKLSVQVHPDDALARATLGQARGKTECWYIVSAEPGACVWAGFRRPLERSEVREAQADRTLESKLCKIHVSAGDMVFVDAGTVHAIGPGVVVLETQQYSDVTYRLWDYGRKRELHVEQGLRAVREETNAGLVPPVVHKHFDRLISCAHFTVDRFHMRAGTQHVLGEVGRLQILVALGEGAQVEIGRAVTPLKPGIAVLLPAGVDAATITGTGKLEVIRVLGPGAALAAEAEDGSEKSGL